MGQIFFRKPFKYTYNKTTFVIIFVNLAVFFLGYFLPKANNYIYTYGSLNPVLVAKYHMYWQFVTYMFVHQNISHIFFNMFGLLIFGLQVERAVGSKEFLLFYFQNHQTIPTSYQILQTIQTNQAFNLQQRIPPSQRGHT